MDEARAILDAHVSERELQDTVVACARSLGWGFIYHTFDSRRSEAGYPDLHLVRGERSVFVELKREGRKPTSAQIAWLDALRAAGHEVYWWRPRDWSSGVIERVLA